MILLSAEEPHAPQIKRDTDIQQDVGGAYAGPFNEGEELKLVCEVHGGKYQHWKRIFKPRFYNSNAQADLHPPCSGMSVTKLLTEKLK